MQETPDEAAGVTDDQRWYWTPEWQAGERQADADIAAGRGRVFRSGEEFLAALDAESPMAVIPERELIVWQDRALGENLARGMQEVARGDIADLDLATLDVSDDEA